MNTDAHTPPAIDNPGAAIAVNMKLLRKEQNLSQEQLSERSGVPRSTIASLERGEGNPTLQVLMGISKGLGVTIADLLVPPAPKAVVYSAEHFRAVQKNLVTKAKDQKNITVDVIRMTPEHSRYLVLEEICLHSAEKFAGTPHPPGTEEYFLPIEGVFEIEVGSETFVLKPGELLCFDGNQRHSYGGHSEAAFSRGLSVVVQVPRV